MLLIDYDYTADDVEEMLMDFDLFGNTLADIKELYEFEDVYEYCKN